jgi:preprotein translocase subunit SecD
MARRAVALVLVLAFAWGGLAVALRLGYLPALGLDLQGGISVILTAPPDTPTEQLEQAVEVMRNRIEDSGVQEPEISIQGDNAVLVQLPGVTDTEAALQIIGTTGQLSFRPVLEVAPLGDTEVSTDDDPSRDNWLPGPGGLAYHVGPSELIGTSIEEAVAAPAQGSAQWGVNLAFDDEGAVLFAQLTADAASYPPGDPRREIAIVLDADVINAPPVAADVSPDVGIAGGQAVITLGSGEEARSEAEELAVVLRYGALPVELERQSLQQVSATLGEEALRTGVVAGLIGLAIVALFLILYYRALGLVAVVGLTVFGSFLLLVFSLLGTGIGLTLTLAGVTGIIVSIGITADSYIVYFERLKEQVRQGVDIEEAAVIGFKKAFRTILTADFVSLTGAFLLWVLAIGPVKGFAIALGIATIIDVIVARWYTANAVRLLTRTGLGRSGFLSIPAASGQAAAETAEAPA